METHRVLVTGCSGFIGPHVVENLERAGHEVVGLDVVKSSYPTSGFFNGDFTQRNELRRALRDVTVVCHLGGVGDVYLAERDPLLAFRANAYGTKVVCDECARLGVEKLVYASTWEVYGQPHSDPIDETHPCAPESHYSISKFAGELFVRRANGLQGMETLALRLGTAYGPRMRENTVIARFISSAKSGKPLTIFGDGTQFRQFTHVSDIGRGFALAISGLSQSGVYNLLSDETITMLDLAGLVARRYGTTIAHQPARLSEPPSAHISAAKAATEFGWKKSISFSDGLEPLLAAPEPSLVTM